jgi:surfeit locus 1 family protein
MTSLTSFYTRFTSLGWFGLVAFVFILLFVRLGFWQLSRADEKKHMLKAYQELKERAPIAWQPGDALPLQYQPIKVEGRFLSDVLLLDNQHYRHQFGYHVISPFVLGNGSMVLVDRGWLAGDVTRQKVPQVNNPSATMSLSGTTYYPSEKTWLLGDAIEQKSAQVAVIELIDTQLISQFLHKSAYPFIIRLGKKEANGYVRHWPIVAMPPQRHYAYALQWFAMALMVFLLLIKMKRKNES